MKKIINKYTNCHNCFGSGRASNIDDSGIIDGVFSAFFGGLQSRCNVCKGSGRVIESEEIIEE